MQDYYNVEKYAKGGFLVNLMGTALDYAVKNLKSPKAAKSLGGVATFFGKHSKELGQDVRHLQTLVKNKAADTEIKALLKSIRTKGDAIYKNSNQYKNKLNNVLRLKEAREAAKKAKNPTQNTVQKTAEKVVDDLAKAKQTATQAAGVVGSTLKDRWAQVKDWVNRNPKTSVLVPLGLVGTGPGRWALGKALGFTQSNPSTWFDDTPEVDDSAVQYIMLNGQKVPVKMSEDGYFVPVTDATSEAPTSDVEAIINSQTATMPDGSDGTQEATAPVTTQELSPASQDTINDLFDGWE